MLNTLYRYIFVAMVGMLALSTTGQVRRIKLCNPSNRAQAAYVDVYDYDFVDEQPQFPGGERGLVNFINKTREYPYKAYEAGIEGRVLCGFIINIDGSVSNIMVLKGCSPELNREAVRVISEMPKWKAGKMDNKHVPVLYVLPVVFRL